MLNWPVVVLALWQDVHVDSPGAPVRPVGGPDDEAETRSLVTGFKK
jgi:hypothetical protein